ncbi:hypothetical protein SAMN04487764_1514 [Gillisia sp. Hel1_33_143]|uniref:hypothetical protein n=1 Tax=Gillisia sp. Hel1_33_143 TaxID=1336796 RepID=UPI00087D201E|nr:hypothetical protein [Gillisia sp. Hel1_33_143]SDS12663.1 hypothetical protein SAMN04487764_1514 [Gillisia sp. Hel1_33_143]
MAVECEDVIPIENLDSCPQDEVVAGISEVGVFGSPIKDFLSIAKPKDLKTALTNEELATIAEAHTFKEGKGFHRVDFIPFSGSVDSVQVGEVGSISMENSLGAAVKGTNARVAGYMRRYTNVPMLYIIKEKNGDVKQIGSELSPAYIAEVGATSGKKPGEAKQTVIKIKDTQAYMAPNYAGTIQEFPAPAPLP